EVFFFQAEDGIRDKLVTGVQTCALPISYTGEAEPRKTLADFIREDCGLTGTHLGCEHGVCGACTILMDGQTVRSCLMFAVQAERSEERRVGKECRSRWSREQ